MTSLPAWPPTTTEDTDVDLLVQLARDYALSHSIVYRPVNSDPTAVIHAPFALFPTPFPRTAFELAVRIQKAYSALYCCLATDWHFLERVVGGNVARVDEFQGELWRIAKQIREEEGVSQPLNLGLFRSDYLLHCPPSTSASSSAEPPISIKQVEFNTISSSFGALSSKVTQLHRHLALASDEYSAAQPPITLDALPENDALVELAAGLALAHNAYLKSEGRDASGKASSYPVKTLFVVQDGERNAFDQRALEWELLQSHGIKVLRQSFSELQTTASLVASDSTSGPSGSSPSKVLHITPQSRRDSTMSQPTSTTTEISVVYFRAGYTPTDYPDARAWSTRLLLERSRAIKCPSVALQLAGAKKVQQVLSEPGELAALVQRHEALRALGDDAFDALRETFTALYPLDDSELGREALRLAYATPERFVLKPQREGGGNNIYREDIPPFLDALDEKDRKLAAVAVAGAGAGAGAGQGDAADAPPPPKHREGYILMDLIQPPEGVSNLLVRAAEREAKLGDVVSELGVYGVALFEDVPATSQAGAQSCRIVENRNAGHLLRTKGRESDEGGVAVGFSVIDSPFLVD